MTVRVLFVMKQADYIPLGLMHLSSALKRAGHEVELVIATHEDPIEVARRFRPGIVGYSIYTGLHRYYLELNKAIKEALGGKVFSAFGGPHATFFPEVIEEEGVDGVCIGEGEDALVDLANALDGGDDYLAIPNWWFKRDGEIIRNPLRPLVEDLDTLPFPDRELFYAKDSFSRESGLKHFISSRGCPYRCSYCYNQAFNALYRGKGKIVRHRSVDNVIEELNWVRSRYPLRFVVFLDDLFIWPLEWVEKFAEKYPREIGLPFFCNVRPNLVTPELVRLLKEAGCHSVGMGVETGDEKMRKEILKRNITDEQIIESARLIKEAGLRLITTNMVGLPGGSLEIDFKTLELNITCRPDYANVFLYQPYPRTELGEYAREHGYLEGTYDDIGPSAWDHTVIRFANPREKRLVENFSKLFALAVEWPWLTPVVKWLIHLPPNPLFRLVYKLWKGYTIKNRIHTYPLSLRELWHSVRHFLKMY
ncbi:MAG TPA: B12-binding domain-containing radical SAM protein [Chloroflexi bacterium]|nr:B12-binding domain-containing radical SAM protein [Chloroflexota bacterium]